MDGWNYFNYFTEIEEYFWKKRGAHLLVSPLDWAIMETWQKAGVPLEAVLKGIDRAFESYGRSRRGAGKPLKSLAYCTDAILEAVAENQEAAERDRVGGDNPLDRVAFESKRVSDGRQRHVHDAEVENHHERRHQHQDEPRARQPGPGVGCGCLKGAVEPTDLGRPDPSDTAGDLRWGHCASSINYQYETYRIVTVV